MKTKHLLTAGLSAMLHGLVLATPPQYSVTFADDGLVPQIVPTGFNNVGSIAGYVYTYPESIPLRLTSNTRTYLGTFGGYENAAFGINDSGQITGYSMTADWTFIRAVRWTANTPVNLFGLGGTSAAGIGINTAGHIAGYSTTAGDEYTRAVRWNARTPVALGNLGGPNSYAYAINDTDQVAGDAQPSFDSPSFHAVRWTGTTPTDLGTLGGPASHASGINASGQVVGWADTNPFGGPHATLWTGTTVLDLDHFGGGESYATAINDPGEVIGMTRYAEGGNNTRAFLYTGGEVHDLVSLLLPGSDILRLDVSYGGLDASLGGKNLNNAGQILALAHYPLGIFSPRLVVLTPTPEPASAVLLLGGTALLGLRRRR